MQLQIKRLSEEAQLPTHATPQSVGLDLHAFLLTETGRPNKAMIPPKTTRPIRTGLIIKPPSGHSIFVCSRSGLAKDYSIFVTNSPSVIDPDYRGELFVLLYNGGFEPYWVQHQDRIGQLIVLPCVPAFPLEVAELDMNTERGASGFGSSGR